MLEFSLSSAGGLYNKFTTGERMFWNKKEKLEFLSDLIYLEASVLQEQINELREEMDYLSAFVGLDD